MATLGLTLPLGAAPVALAQRRSQPHAAASRAVGPAAAFTRRAPLAAASRARAVTVRAAAEEAAPMQGSDPKTMTVSLPSVLDINEIMNRLPHRFPFLLVRARAPARARKLFARPAPSQRPATAWRR
jgi:hypothetical protein